MMIAMATTNYVFDDPEIIQIFAASIFKTNAMSNKIKIVLAGSFLVAVILSSWFFLKGPENNLIGGHCEYDTLMVPAKIIRMEKYPEEFTDLLLEIKLGNDRADTFYFSRQYPYKSLTKDQVRNAGLKEGDELVCTCYKISSGSCSPHIYIPSLEKFLK